MFSFMHDETSNACHGAGCSDDIVTISNLVTSDVVDLGGILYTLTLLGFSADGPNNISNIFTSPEGHTNTATLYAQFTTVVTPLPAALPLFLTMLGGIGFLRWRRPKALAA